MLHPIRIKILREEPGRKLEELRDFEPFRELLEAKSARNKLLGPAIEILRYSYSNFAAIIGMNQWTILGIDYEGPPVVGENRRNEQAPIRVRVNWA